MDRALPATSPETGARSSHLRLNWRRRLRLVQLVIAAAALVIAGIGGREIARRGTDLPPLAELAHDAGTIYAGRAEPIWRAIVANINPADRWLKLAAVAINGQIDDRLLSLVAVVLQTAAVMVFLGFVGRRFRLRTVAVLGMAAIGLALMPAATALAPVSHFTALTVVPLLSFLHLSLTFERRRWRRWVGFALGAANVLCASAGVASTMAIAAVEARHAFSRGAGSESSRPRFWANAVLGVVGLAMIAVRMHLARSGLTFWSVREALVIVIILAPAIGWGWRRFQSRSPRVEFSSLTIWSIAVTMVVGCTGTGVVAAAPVFWFAVLVSGTALMVGADGEDRTRRFILVGIWLTLVAAVLLRSEATAHVAPESTVAATYALRSRTRPGPPDLPPDFPPTADETAAARIVAESPGLAPLLPSSVRPALPLAIRGGQPPPFDVPQLPGRDQLIVFGFAPPGRITSGPVRSDATMLMFKIAGILRPPQTTLVLRTRNGVEIPPLGASASALDHWQRVNFRTPRGPFEVVATASSSNLWLAFTPPVEVGNMSRVVAKLPRLWPLLVTAGLVGAVFYLAAEGVRVDRRIRKRVSLVERIPWAVLPWIALFAYAMFFSAHVDSTAGPNDSGGYLNSAKLLAHGQVTGTPRTIFGSAETDITPYVPTTFHSDGRRLVPEYPVGWPLEVAAMARLIGFGRGVPLLILLQLVLATIFTQRLARELGLPAGWSWLAAALVGLSPVYVFVGLQPVSDGPALVWVTAAIYWAWRSRDRAAFALLAGIATALAVLIRPSNLLVTIPIVIGLFGRWRQVGYWVLGGLPGAAWLSWYQHALYGHPFVTGYGDVSAGFAWRFLAPTLQSYARWLPEFLTPLVLLAPIGLFVRSVPGRVRLMLAVWAGLFVGFYAVYWCTWDNWYNMRFLLPAFPALAILALLGVRAVAERFQLSLFTTGGALRAVLPTGLLVVFTSTFLMLRIADRDVTRWMHWNAKPAEASAWIRDHVPPDAVVFARHLTGSLYYYTNLTFVRLDHPSAQDPALYDRIARTGRPMFAFTAHWETPGFKWGHGLGSGYPGLPGTWDRVALLCEGDTVVWKLRENGATSK